MKKIDQNLFSKYRKSIIFWSIIGIIITAFIMMISDIREVLHLLSGINIKILPFILILAPLNYLLRYVKWNYYLKQIEIKLSPHLNRAIFISGLSMTITPGKIGELVKAYLIKEVNGTKISVTSPVIMAERLTDAVAMIILASVGSLAYSYGQYILLFTFLFLTAVIAALYFEKLYNVFRSILAKFSFLQKYLHLLDNFQQSSHQILDPKSLTVAVLIGIVSWGCEGLVVYLSLLALGGNISILGSIFVVSFSSIVGAVSVLPGGLGVAEGSIMGILILLGTSRGMAAATTLITRFSTLWLGVVVGVFGLIYIRKYLN